VSIFVAISKATQQSLSYQSIVNFIFFKGLQAFKQKTPVIWRFDF
jgi:hypothetical protein